MARAVPQLACGTVKRLPGVDWVGDNGALTLAGDWLMQSELLGQPLMIEVLSGKITIRAEQGSMLA
ncbi:SymE family type I addiction module toxin [Pectobacterium wasabiae]|uniref:SymE family type I addiction module toxin n=1 Tax=Pectobacterium wasabiae TaxID=55208 RepID=UPI00027B08B7|nr:SymE family type I addiction module toxin [Pectobacterium wasabiae]AOR63404.1 hypothetical protein A7983_09045 [Pectobacterium wasabiae CFBP 3304]EJS94558.1 Hypothetical protein Y17_2196 [Pectobacterium wasabiae CFBP 3304]